MPTAVWRRPCCTISTIISEPSCASRPTFRCRRSTSGSMPSSAASIRKSTSASATSPRALSSARTARPRKTRRSSDCRFTSRRSSPAISTSERECVWVSRWILTLKPATSSSAELRSGVCFRSGKRSTGKTVMADLVRPPAWTWSASSICAGSCAIPSQEPSRRRPWAREVIRRCLQCAASPIAMR